MPLVKPQKQAFIRDLKEKLDQQKIILFADFSGLKAKEMSKLRQKLKESDALFWVGRKTLINLALQEKGLLSEIERFKGQLALILGFDDEVQPAKILYQFQQEHQAPTILGGLFENKFVEKEEVINWATLPSQAELRAKLVGSLSSPLTGWLSVLQGNLRNLIYVLSGINPTS